MRRDVLNAFAKVIFNIIAIASDLVSVVLMKNPIFSVSDKNLETTVPVSENTV